MLLTHLQKEQKKDGLNQTVFFQLWSKKILLRRQINTFKVIPLAVARVLLAQKNKS